MRGSTKTGIFLLAAILAVLSSLPFQAEDPPWADRQHRPKALPTKIHGEAGIIVKRHMWFYGPRKEGSEGGMALKREQAAEFTRQAMKSRRAESGDTWISRGPSSSAFGDWRFGKVSGRIPSLAKDWENGILYVGSASGGVWRSNNEGATWTSIFNTAGTQTIGEIVVDPASPNILWVGTGENSMWCEEYFGIGLMRSEDGGETWEARNGTGSDSLVNLTSIGAICIDPRNSDHLVIGGFWWGCSRGAYGEGGIFTTDDAGLSWTKRLAGRVTQIARDPYNPDILWAGLSSGLWNESSGGVFRSGDGGITWDPVTASGLPEGSTGRVEVAIAPSNPNVIYALFESIDGGYPQFWRTSDGGASWTLMSNKDADCNGQCWYDMALQVHNTNPDIVYRGTVRIFKTENGGSTWKDLSGYWGPSQKVHQDTHALLMDPEDPNTIYVGCDGGIWKTVDGGTSFINLNSNLCLTQFYDVGIHPEDDGIIVGGSQDNSSLARVSSDTWDLMEVTGDGFVSLINPQNPKVVYTASYAYPWDDTQMPTIFRSQNGPTGEYYLITDYGCGIIEGDRQSWVTPYTLDPRNPSILLLGTYRMYRSTDGGDNWTRVGPDDMCGGDDYIISIAYSRTDSRWAYVGTTNGRVWRTSDGGDNWTEISSGLPRRQVNDVEPDASDPSRAYAAVSGFGTAHLYALIGEDWEPASEGLPDVPTNAVLSVTSSDIIVGTDVGVFRSSDGAQTFAPWTNGIPLGSVVMDLEFNPRTQTITAGTYGRGAWQAQLPTCVLSCAAQGPSSALVNETVSFTASASGQACTGTATYSWDFGDGSASSTEQNPSHAYTSAGSFSWTCTATIEGSQCTQSGSVVVTATPPPTVSSLAKLSGPFRIKITGTNFQSGVKVKINGSEWVQTIRKTDQKLILKGGSALKSAVPKGVQTTFTIINPDGGTCDINWNW
ncbi:MAG TPA: PKD domain-containing protein [Acidobacteriota bacterium]|nr:PKD domain-containing protein [Acidobacteriota bacterium]